jgi:hypothetical protein
MRRDERNARKRSFLRADTAASAAALPRATGTCQGEAPYSHQRILLRPFPKKILFLKNSFCFARHCGTLARRVPLLTPVAYGCLFAQ